MIAKATLRALSAANAIALKARVGTLDGHEVTRLEAYVAQHLAEDDPVRAVVAGFAIERRRVARDRAAMAEIGADLQRQVVRLLWPEPQGRVDIHG